MFALGLPCSAPAFSSVKRRLLSSCRAQASHCNSSGTQLHPKTDSWSCSKLWEAGRLLRRRKEGNPVGFQVWLEDRGQGFLRKGPTWVVGDAFPCPASWILANSPLRGITFLICVLSLVHENIVFFTCRSRKKIGIQRCLGIEGALTEEVGLDVEKVMGRQGWGSTPVTSTGMRYGEGLEWSYWRCGLNGRPRNTQGWRLPGMPGPPLYFCAGLPWRSLPQMAALEGCWILKQVRQSLGEGWLAPGIEEVPTGFLWRPHGAELMGHFYCFWESKCKRPGFNSWVGRIPWKRKWQPTPVFLPGESHGQEPVRLQSMH